MCIKLRTSDPKSKNSLKKNYAVLIFMILGLVFIDYSSCRADGFLDYQGVTGFYGQSNWTNIGPDPLDDYEWYNISYLVGKDLKSWLSLEALLGPGYIETDNFGESGTVEFRLLLDIHNQYLYLKFGGGIAYLFDSDDMPDLSDADFFAIASVGAGFRYQFNDDKENGPEITLGYSVEHLSDPFKGGDDGDSGLNLGAIKAEFTWSF